jgi:large subunit ribosomal protein L10
MASTVEAKQAIVTEVAAVAKTAQSAVAAEYRGLTVAEMTKLRASARQAGVYVRVVKNTLARRAIEGTSFECMKGSLKGPLVLAFSREDPGAAARVVKGFSKEHDKLKTVALSIGGELYPASDIDRLASLPTLTDARTSLVRVLAAPCEAREDAGRARGDAGPNAEGSQRAAAVIVQRSYSGNSPRRLKCRCRMQNWSRR